MLRRYANKSRTCWAVRLSSNPSGMSDFSAGPHRVDRVRSRVASWPSLSRRMTTFLSCSTITPERMRPSRRGDDRADESFANLGAGIDDVQEHRLEIVATVGCQVGAELSSLAEKRMTPGALLFKDLLAGLGNSGSFTNRRRRSDRSWRDARLSRRVSTGPHRRVIDAVDRGIAEQHQLFDDLARNAMSVDCPDLDGFEEFDCPRLDATASKLWAAASTSSVMLEQALITAEGMAGSS